MPSDSTWKPYYWNGSLLAYGNRNGLTTVELTSTSHGAVMRVSFPPYVDDALSVGFNQTRRIAVLLNQPYVEAVAVTQGGGGEAPSITGFSAANSGGVAGSLRHYFNMTVTGGVNGDVPVTAFSAGTSMAGTLWAFLDFDPTDPTTQVLTLRVATSLISQAQATVNLASEIGESSFDEIMAASKAEWRATLSRANIVDVGSAYPAQAANDYLTIFYSSLWRATQFPRKLYEVAANGSAMHWSPYSASNQVFPGPLSADSGFWDAYRTVYPQLSLLYPATLGELMQGWVNAYSESGWLPKWASPGHRQSMVGTMGDVSLADAIVKGIAGFDVQSAYAAIRKDAFVLPPNGAGNIGRTCLAAYLQDGYVASGAQGAVGTCSEVVSRTQNYWLSDFAIAQAAKALGNNADYAVLSARAANYSRLFEPSTAFFRSRASGMGAFTGPFDEFAWGGDYTEAGPHQYRFYIPYDPQGLAALYAQSGLNMCDVLQAEQLLPGAFHIGGYGDVIHEMTEMASLCWGQNEHDNQPVHHWLWTFIALDNSTQGACAARGQYWLRQAMTRLHSPGSDMYCGDEDNGEMASWYLLATMGLYALAPGTPDYMLGAPLFAHMSLSVEGSNATIEIIANNSGPDNFYVQSVTWNGKPIAGTSISYFDLMQGGTLQFTMTDVAPAGAGTPSGSAATASTTSAAVPQWVQSAAAGSHARLRARGGAKSIGKAKAAGSGSA